MSDDQYKGPISGLSEESKAPLDAYMDLFSAIERSGFVLSPCGICGEVVVCIPDGLALCKPCAEKVGGQ
jgi:hypothetical protein